MTITLVNVETDEREVRADLTQQQARALCIERNKAYPEDHRSMTNSDVEDRINRVILRPWYYKNDSSS